MQTYQNTSINASNPLELSPEAFTLHLLKKHNLQGIASNGVPEATLPVLPITPKRTPYLISPTVADDYAAPPSAQRGVGVSGFITSRISLTKDQERYSDHNTIESYLETKENIKLSRLRKKLRKEHSLDDGSFRDRYNKQIDFGNRDARSVFRVDRYKSGEIVGTFVNYGLHSKYALPTRPESIETVKLSDRSLKKLRRAVENAATNLKFFLTLTFSPCHVPDDGKNEDGTVNHTWAKKELKRFLHWASVTMERKGTPLNYLWVAEIQTKNTNNIHFHVLWDRYFPISKLTERWGQAKNSVDIESVKDPRHACNYIRKYLSKQDEISIAGNRYGITAGLRETMTPETSSHTEKSDLSSTRETIKALSDDIKETGGFVHEYGFCIGVPSRSALYRDRKTGETKKSRGLPKWLSVELMNILFGEVPF